MDFFEAMEAVSPVLGDASLVGLLRGAEQAGLLAGLVDPVTVDDLATRTGLPAGRVGSVVQALMAHDVVEDARGRYALSEPWRVLAGPGALVPLSRHLALARVEARMLEELGRGADYWSMPSEDRLAYATGVSPDPFLPAVVEATRAAAEHDPDKALLARGGLYLELGCGVAGRVLTYLQAFPALRAVGVELAEDLAAEARARAARLGLDDRFEVVVCDAATFDRPGQFDFGFWSQFFFPAPSRAPALAALLRSLRPGGVAWSPRVAEADEADELGSGPSGAAPRAYALTRVVWDAWGIPERTGPQLREEFLVAGFVDVTITSSSNVSSAGVRALRP